MILNNAVNAGFFVYCPAYFSPYETNTYHNSGNGHYHKFTYIVDGKGIAEIRKELDLSSEVIEYNDDNSAGKLLDISHTKDLYNTTITKDQGLSLINFNPIPATRNIDVKILNGPWEGELQSDKRFVVVGITGTININDKELLGLQHAKVLPNKNVKLKLGEKAVCALVYNED